MNNAAANLDDAIASATLALEAARKRPESVAWLDTLEAAVLNAQRARLAAAADGPPMVDGCCTLAEATTHAVAQGILARVDHDTRAYDEAKRGLIGWCIKTEVSDVRRELAVGEFRSRVAVVAGVAA